MTARQRAWADSMSLNVIAKAAVRDPAPRVTFVRSRTVANVDSIGFVVRRWIQCSACVVQKPCYKVSPARMLPGSGAVYGTMMLVSVRLLYLLFCR
ncbi:hypothetical protein ABIA31_003620, partial [Catenulispora sp. MAP5-51]